MIGKKKTVVQVAMHTEKTHLAMCIYYVPEFVSVHREIVKFRIN